MSDEQHPTDDGADIDVPHLAELSEGVNGSPTQWAMITEIAAHRRQRRTWLLSAVAALVLLAGTAAVALSSSGSDAVSVASGGVTGGYVIPPDGASDVSIQRSATSYGIYYVVEGSPWMLRVYDAGDPVIPEGEPLPVMLDRSAAEVGARTFDSPDLGTVYAACMGRTSSASGVDSPVAPDGTAIPNDTMLPPDTTVLAESGPMVASWLFGDGIGMLQPASTDAGRAPCSSAVGPPTSLVDAVQALRVVDAAGFQRFLDGIGGGTPTTSVPDVSSLPSVPPSTTTTVVADPPADQPSAVEQITRAVAGFSERGADGTFPNLEDGTTKAAEYRQMFDLAGRQSGAAQVEDHDGDTSTLSRLTFVSPERARITIEFTSTLPSGTFTFGQEGEAILQDGRWVITYRTVITTLGRACVPPGGYDGC